METVYRVMDALLPFELFRYAFMKNALLALLLLTPLLALLGTMAVNQRMAFFSDALGHSALAGLGLGVLLGLSNVTLILVLFGILWAVLITRINRTGSASSDTTISVFSSAGIALGLLILSGSGQYNKYSSILVGDVLAIAPADILWLAIALAVGVILWAALYNQLLLTAVNPQLAQSRGIAVKWVEYAFVILVAVAVMLSIRWVGVLLINALLILPAAAARNIARSVAQHALLSVLISVFSGVARAVRIRAAGLRRGRGRGAVRRRVLCRQPADWPRAACSSASLNDRGAFMKLYHDSRSLDCRAPFGAVRCGDIVRLRVYCQGRPRAVNAVITLNNQPYTIPLQPDGRDGYELRFAAPATPRLLWYYFAAVMENGQTEYLGNARDGLGGVGETYASAPRPFS